MKVANLRRLIIVATVISIVHPSSSPAVNLNSKCAHHHQTLVIYSGKGKWVAKDSFMIRIVIRTCILVHRKPLKKSNSNIISNSLARYKLQYNISNIKHSHIISELLHPGKSLKGGIGTERQDFRNFDFW